jgi:hypothetical protein
MAEVLFAGGGLDSVTCNGTFAEVTTAGTFDATYCDKALQLFNVTASWVATGIDTAGAAKSVTTAKTFFGHCECYWDGIQTVMNVFVACDAAGNEWAGVRCKAASNYGLYVNTGTVGAPTWTQIGADFLIPAAARHTFDLRVFIDAAGTAHQAEFILDNASKATGSFSNANLTALQKLKGVGANIGGSNAHYSQIMITEGISTVAGKVDYNVATGAGTNAGFTGVYTDINETVLNDATLIAAATAGLKSSYAYGDVTVPTNYVLKSAFLFSRGKNDGTINLKALCRSGGTDYPAGSNLPGIGVAFGPLGWRFDTDPNTGAAWTQANFNAAEFGAQSA